MADVTVKAYAELVNTPLYGQMRILREQKYPKQTDGQFKIPFYQPALRHFRRYYKSGNDPAHLPNSTGQMTGCGSLQAKIDHNWRAIQAFRNGGQFDRQFNLIDAATHHVQIGDVDMRATADFIVNENGNQIPKYVTLQPFEAGFAGSGGKLPVVR